MEHPAHVYLQKCIEVTEKTDYDAWFGYSAHIQCISVDVKRKKSDEYIGSWPVMSFSRQWQKRELDKVLTTLDSMLDGTFKPEEVNDHE